MKKCKIKDCDVIAIKRGWCNKHWLRWRRHGNPHKTVKVFSYEGTICCISNCNRKPVSRKMCVVHYSRWFWRKNRGPIGDLSIHQGQNAKRMSHLPEYKTVHGHLWAVKNHYAYKGMPFFDDWNPNKGGAVWKGAKWIIDNLGPKPKGKWSLDIVKHELGFVPGNLRWANHLTQQRNKVFRALGQITISVLKIELLGRGYVIRKRNRSRINS